MREEKFVGAFLGTFVGDALGMPVEGWPREAIARRFGQLRDMLPARLGAGTYTDDTEMMIGLAESLLRCGGLDPDDLARTFARNLDLRRGYGPGTIRVLRLIGQGVPWEEAALRVFPGGSFGNGAAMRIAPVGCLYYRDPAELARAARLSAAVTHAHPLAREGAALLARAVALAVAADPAQPPDRERYLAELQLTLLPEGAEYLGLLDRLARLLRSRPAPDEVIRELGNDVRITHSVGTALYSFLAHIGSFEEAVVYAVNLGGDADTIGAMTGALAGAYHGTGGIPVRWLERLEEGPRGRSYVEHLARRLWRLSEHRGQHRHGGGWSEFAGEGNRTGD